MTQNERIEFIKRIAPWAQRSQEKFGVPASIVIAQAILESSDQKGNWGKSVLAAKYNNYFGIKDNPRLDDGYCELRAAKVGDQPQQLARFASFKDAQRCFDAHGRLLSRSKTYQPAMSAADDPLVFAARLQKCGYSEDREYASKLRRLMTDERYDLLQYDVKKESGGTR